MRLHLQATRNRVFIYCLVLFLVGGALFWSPDNAQALQISQLVVSDISATSASISWNTDAVALGLVDYGTTTYPFYVVIHEKTSNGPTGTRSLMCSPLNSITQTQGAVLANFGAVVIKT